MIGARHLTKAKRGIVSPSVEVEIIGCHQDSANNKVNTKIISIICNQWTFAVM